MPRQSIEQFGSERLPGVESIELLPQSFEPPPGHEQEPKTGRDPQKEKEKAVKITSIKLSAPSKKIAAGKKVKLKAKVSATKGANKKVAWSSNKPKFAKVSANGTVKAYKAGKGKKVKNTCKSLDGSNKKKTVTIRIK